MARTTVVCLCAWGGYCALMGHLSAEPAELTRAFAPHVEALRKQLPPGFSLVTAKPFVVIGNEAPDTVHRYAERTVQWTTHFLESAYFSHEPDHVIDVWLFRDRASYVAGVQRLTGEPPDTPYGFYSASHNALFMNISTGAGTLVHELVHPFVEANVPDAPAWFNEGLASLYEQCTEVNGQIVGLTNWRLAGLQEALREQGLPSFRELAAMRDHDFYAGRRGDNYAQARYLFYYLQERGLLRAFVAAFIARGDDDPSGYATLQRVLGEKDMPEFQRRWEQLVLKLRFDGP